MFNNIDFLVIFLVIGWGNTYEKKCIITKKSILLNM